MGTSELKGIVNGAAIGRRALLAAAMTAANRARVSCGTVEYYVDGIDEKHIVMTEANVVAGPYDIPEQAGKTHRQRPATSTNALARTAAADFWPGSPTPS